MSIFANAARYFFPCFAIITPLWCKRAANATLPRGLINNLNAHITSGAFNLLDSIFQVNRIRILILDFSNLTHLGASHLANLLPVGFGRSLLNSSSLFEENCGRR